MPQKKLPSILKMSSASTNVIEDLAQIVTSGELSDALRLYNEVRKEAERAAAEVLPSTSTTEEQSEVKEDKSVCLYNFSCSLCNEIFENQEDLTSHNCLHDPNVNVMYECQECRTLFQSLDALAQHMKIHEENVVVIRSSRVNKHSPKEKVGYVCPICDKVLSSKGSVIKHQELHKGLKPYVCNFCGKSFSIKGNRDKHEMIHFGEKPHKCNICEKNFTFKGNLKKHLLTHTNQKGYTCELCQKEFTLKGNLDKHLKRHEKGLRTKPKLKQVHIDEQAELEEIRNTGEDQVSHTGVEQTSVEVPPVAPGGLRFNVNVNVVDKTTSISSESEVKEIVKSIKPKLITQKIKSE